MACTGSLYSLILMFIVVQSNTKSGSPAVILPHRSSGAGGKSTAALVCTRGTRRIRYRKENPHCLPEPGVDIIFAID